MKQAIMFAVVCANCFAAGDHVQMNNVPPQQQILAAMIVHAAAGNHLGEADGRRKQKYHAPRQQKLTKNTKFPKEKHVNHKQARR